jgi:hypothetical protein
VLAVVAVVPRALTCPAGSRIVPTPGGRDYGSRKQRVLGSAALAGVAGEPSRPRRALRLDRTGENLARAARTSGPPTKTRCSMPMDVWAKPEGGI